MKHRPTQLQGHVFVTKHHEYHFRDGVCGGVVDRQTGRWMDHHPALRRSLEGGVVRTRTGRWPVPDVSIGCQLMLRTAEEDGPYALLTSPVERIVG